jgi:hypothetical protein
MQFQVPQFIEVEDKIFGPLTFKQFIYILGGAGLAYLVWRVLPVFLAAPLVASAIGLGVALAFFQFNGRPFILALEFGFYYLVRSKLYLWNNERRDKPKKEQKKEDKPKNLGDLYVPHLSESRLRELAWSLDIKEKIAAGIADNRDREAGPRSDIVAPIRTAQGALVQ